ncbi:flagellar biosynthetic protein FliO [Ruminococcaceae bacterium OttesenSCG-928-I18]|nr:flagellar biosynthetic protein FliO [Ruminococcaceae bacterium OttesenSCG-928-I18]
MGFGEIILRILGAIVALAVVLFLAWFTLRWLNKRVPGMPGGGGRLINILDRVSFGKNSSLLLVRVQNKVFLVAMSEHAIQAVHEFDDPDEEMKLPEQGEALPFSDALKQAVSKLKKPSDDGPGGTL